MAIGIGNMVERGFNSEQTVYTSIFFVPTTYLGCWLAEKVKNPSLQKAILIGGKPVDAVIQLLALPIFSCYEHFCYLYVLEKVADEKERKDTQLLTSMGKEKYFANHTKLKARIEIAARLALTPLTLPVKIALRVLLNLFLLIPVSAYITKKIISEGITLQSLRDYQKGREDSFNEENSLKIWEVFTRLIPDAPPPL